MLGAAGLITRVTCPDGERRWEDEFCFRIMTRKGPCWRIMGIGRRRNRFGMMIVCESCWGLERGMCAEVKGQTVERCCQLLGSWIMSYLSLALRRLRSLPSCGDIMMCQHMNL